MKGRTRYDKNGFSTSINLNQLDILLWDANLQEIDNWKRGFILKYDGTQNNKQAIRLCDKAIIRLKRQLNERNK